jgi:hypothetical protein
VDYIRSCAYQLGGHCIQSGLLAEATAIDLKISALNIATGSEFLKESSPNITVSEIPVVGQNPNMTVPPGFLRPSNRER